jgi:hypothetical protein
MKKYLFVLCQEGHPIEVRTAFGHRCLGDQCMSYSQAGDEGTFAGPRAPVCKCAGPASLCIK